MLPIKMILQRQTKYNEYPDIAMTPAGQPSTLVIMQ